jgi:poly(hydroxyalkanoate) depolymerase family esterase
MLHCGNIKQWRAFSLKADMAFRSAALMINPFRKLTRGSRQVRRGISAALSIQRMFLPLMTASKQTEKPQKPSTRTTRGLAEKTDRTKRPAPGTFIDGSFTSREGTLAYKLYTPEGSTRRKLPLVVMLHGCTQSAADFAAGTGMNKLADEIGFLVLYPQQSLSANLTRCWNWHRPGDQKRSSGEPALVAALTRQTIKICKADSSRVYIAGISAGGAAAAIVAAAYPDLYVAVGVHSGLPRGNVTTIRGALSAMRTGADTGGHGGREKRARPLPTIVFQGDRDTVVHPANANGFLVELNRSSPHPIVGLSEQGSKGGREFIRSQYRSVSGPILLESWDVRGGGHAWSGGSLAGSFADPTGPNASREMVRFFLAYKRSALGPPRAAIRPYSEVLQPPKPI